MNAVSQELDSRLSRLDGRIPTGELVRTSEATTRRHAGPQAGSLQIDCYKDLAALEFLRPAWEGLLARIPTASIFSTWEWLASWWRAYGEGSELLVLGCTSAGGELVGVAPLALHQQRVAPGIRLRTLRFMGDGSGDSDNLDILAVPGHEPAVISAILAFLRQEERTWDLAQLNLLPWYSPTGIELRSQLHSLGWTAFQYTDPGCVLHLPETWEAYLKEVSRKERKNIRTWERRLARDGQARFYKCTHEAELPACLQVLFDLHQKRWQSRGEPGRFVSAARRQFYHEIGRLFLARNWLEFWLLDVNGQPAAAEFSFRYRDTVYALQQGFDMRHAQLSVQDAIRAHVLREVIQQGVRHYDFLGGQNVRKERWGAEVRNYVNIHFARPRSRGSMYLQAVHDAMRSKEWLRDHLPASAWSVLHRMNVWLRGAQSSSVGAETDAPTAESADAPAEKSQGNRRWPGG